MARWWPSQRWQCERVRPPRRDELSSKANTLRTQRQQPACDRRPGLAEGALICQQPRARVRAETERVDLKCELGGIIDAGDRRLALELAQPVDDSSADDVAHGPRAIVELRR